MFSGGGFAPTGSAKRLRPLKGQRTNLSSDKPGKNSTEHLSLLFIGTGSQAPGQHLPYPSFHCKMYLKEELLPLTSFARFNSSWALVLPTKSLQCSAMPWGTNQVTCPCFLFLCSPLFFLVSLWIKITTPRMRALNYFTEAPHCKITQSIDLFRPKFQQKCCFLIFPPFHFWLLLILI